MSIADIGLNLKNFLRPQQRIGIPRGRHTYGPEPDLVGIPFIAVGSKIGSFCSIAPGLKFILLGKHMTNWVSTYPFSARWGMDVPLANLPDHFPILIGNDVWIATNVKILQGVTVGDGAVIATESFVTKDVPPYAIVGGHPAQTIRYRFTEKQIEELLEIAWWNWDDEEIRKVVPLLTSDNIDKFIEVAKEVNHPTASCGAS